MSDTGEWIRDSTLGDRKDDDDEYDYMYANVSSDKQVEWR